LLRHVLLHAGVEILELRVTIGMLAALARLAIALQAVAELTQQLGDDVRADVVPHVGQRRAQFVEALGGPKQRRHRIAARRGFEQLLQIVQKRRVLLRLRLAPTARPPHAPFPGRAVLRDLRDAAIDRRAGDARHGRDECHPATAERTSLSRREPSPRLLVEHRIQRLKALPNQVCRIRHARRLPDTIPPCESPPRDFALRLRYF
jgi:hypothetical protein